MFCLVDILCGLAIFGVALLARLVPVWKSRNQGCDAYYYLLCVEEYKKKRRLPIVLPTYYLLDVREQWYPPGFVVFLSLFPTKWLKSNYWLVTPLLDSITAGLLAVMVGLMTHNDLIPIMAGIAYVLAYPAWGECRNLNSRPLGNLLLAGMMLPLFEYTTSFWMPWLFVSAILGVVVVMTHKMTAQYLYFGLPVLSLVFWTPMYVFVLAVALLICWILFPMFPKMIRSQWDILTFWNRNWCNLGAHQVYSSPVYGDESRHDGGRVFDTGWRGLLRNVQYMGINTFAVMLVFPLLNYGGLDYYGRLMLWWALSVYILAMLTLFIPQLRFYGEGYKYLRMAVFPIGCLVGKSLCSGGFNVVQVVIIYGLAVLGALILMWWGNKRSKMFNPEVDDDLGKVLEYLRRDDVKVVMSIPVHLMDTVVYHCRKLVVWGTHSDNFKDVEPLFPVFRKLLEWFVSKYGVTHVLMNRAYCLPNEVGLRDGLEVFSSGLYGVYKIN